MSSPASPADAAAARGAAQPTPGTLTRAERMGRLPWTRQHTRILAGAGGGWALDAMDVGLIGFVVAALAKEWGLGATEKSWVLTAGFAGMAIGATVGGLLADRFGRRHVFAVTLLLYGLATGASALSTGLAMLLALRFLVGLGLGAELPVASTLVSEIAPTRIRGRVVVALESFWAVGWVLAAVVAKFVIPEYHDGWRWALALGALPAIYSVVVRWAMPESPSYLERRGRTDEAEQVVRRFESAAGAAPVRSVPLPAAAPASVADLLAPGLRVRTIGICLVWFFVNLSYYGAFLWLPSILDAQLGSLSRSFTYTLVITLAQLPGYAAAAFLIERWGRRVTLAAFLVGSAVAAALFGMAHDATSLVLSGCLLSFFNLGAWGALYAVTPEIFPTRVRGTGAGMAAGLGRVASVLSPWFVPWFAEGSNNVVTFALFAASFVGAALAAALLLPERAGRQLEA